MAELELKLVFPPGAGALVAAHPRLAGVESQTHHLVSTYWDTPGRALRAARLSLRVRETDGARVQTLKAPGDGFARGEWEWTVDGERPDLSLLEEIGPERLPLGTAVALRPVCTTDVTREVRRIEIGGSDVEVAIDQGQVQAPEGGSEAIHELELELKEGSPAPLYRLALALEADLPLRIGVEAKAERGERLGSGAAPESRKSEAPALSRDAQAGDALRRIVAAATRGLLANVPAARAGDPEGVHQMRVSIRRLRAALVLFGPLLDPAAAGCFDEELRRFGRVLGAARDWDVFCLETLPRALPAAADEMWRDLLAREAAEERDAAHRALAEELDGPSLTRLVVGLAAFLEESGPEGMLLANAPALLGAVARKVARRGRGIEKRSGSELHALRKSLKKLRYGAEYLAGLFEEDAVKRYLKACKGLQGLLGEMNDAAVAYQLAAGLAGRNLALVPALAAVGRWGKGCREAARAELREAWVGFRRVDEFW